MIFQFIEDDDRKGEVEHSHIVFQFLFPADENPSEPVHPTVGSLYHPSPGWLLWVSIGNGVLSTVSDMWGEAITANQSIDALVVIALVLTKILLSFGRRYRAKGNDVFQSRFNELHIMDVCSGDFPRQGNAVCVG